MNLENLSSSRLAMAALLMCVAVPSFGQWTTGQSAESVVGKGSFTDNTDDGPSASRIAGTHGVAIDAANGKMYVGDTFRHRVLRFAYPITSNGQAADLVFGQSNFTSGNINDGGVSASSLHLPIGLSVDSSGRLAIADFNNNRVLIFDNAHQISANKPSANRVLGQTSFTGTSAATSQGGLSGPVQPSIDGSGNLWVADRANHRVLRFDNVASAANGANASLVLGQSTFGTNGTGSGSTGYNTPEGVVRIGSSLFVSDATNHRVLRYDNIDGKGNGAAADAVLGQTSFTGTTGGLAQNRFNYPRGLAGDASGRLYVADEINHRIMIFDSAASKTDGANADSVLGQINFDENSLRTDQEATQNPIAVSVDPVNNKLGVVEYGNKRVTIFSASSSLPVSLSAFGID